MTIGVLAFHGDVIEHIKTAKLASNNLRLHIDIIPIRTKKFLRTLDALIIPGGESTTLHKLCKREHMWEEMKRMKNIFGTCAGAIMLAKTVHHKTPDQKTLELMDIEIDRNAYGRQTESFQKIVRTKIGDIDAVFIRAPKITDVGKNVTILGKDEKEILACEEVTDNHYYLATCFHPELTSTLFHEYFIKKVYRLVS